MLIAHACVRPGGYKKKTNSAHDVVINVFIFDLPGSLSCLCHVGAGIIK